MSERKAKLEWYAGGQRWGCTYDLVSQPGIWGLSRCSNKAKYDPDADGNPTRCGIHCEAAVAKRRAKSDARYQEWKAKLESKFDLRKSDEEAREILKQIADGHNDPRSLALDWVKRRAELAQ